MSELTLIGLGAMGSAIARTLIDKKYDMTVWNRSPEKVETLVELGASSAQSLKQAIESSQIILFCIHGYAATRTLLDDPEIIALLPGRIVIQMSTGTSAEARPGSWVSIRNCQILYWVYTTVLLRPVISNRIIRR